MVQVPVSKLKRWVQVVRPLPILLIDTPFHALLHAQTRDIWRDVLHCAEMLNFMLQLFVVL